MKYEKNGNSTETTLLGISTRSSVQMTAASLWTHRTKTLRKGSIWSYFALQSLITFCIYLITGP